MTIETPVRPVEAFRQPPVFGTIAEERRHRKERLVGAFRLFSKFGFDEGVAGHITARDPELLDHFWVNPLGKHFSRIKVSDLLLINQHGEVIEGNRPVNRAAVAIHTAIHAARPDVVAAAHAHSTYGKAWSSLGKLLDPLTQDSCAFYGDHTLFDDFTGVVLDASEGNRIAKTLAHHKAVILRNHGLLTVGHTVEAAAWWFITMERNCQVQLLAEAAGKPIKIDHDTASFTQSQIGTHNGGWFSFQPLWERITAEQPDFLD